MRAPGADPGSRLVSTMIDVLVTELAEPGRLRRGRAYARQGAVGPITVAHGMVSAVVQGSSPQPYVVSARVDKAIASGQRLISLVPSRREIRFTCSCPDDDSPCKHAVALMAAFSERLAYDGALFLRWRTGADVLEPPPGDPDAQAVGRATGRPRTSGTGRSNPAMIQAHREVLCRFLDGSAGQPRTTDLSITELDAPTNNWSDVWLEMLTSTLETLRRLPPPR